MPNAIEPADAHINIAKFNQSTTVPPLISAPTQDLAQALAACQRSHIAGSFKAVSEIVADKPNNWLPILLPNGIPLDGGFQIGIRAKHRP